MSLPFTFGASLPTLSMPRIVHGWVVQSASGILAMTWTSNDEEEGENLYNCQFYPAYSAKILLNIGTLHLKHVLLRADFAYCVSSYS
jgi:hypothetical protein